MAWYRNGTVAVTNGSANVIGAGTDFVSNVKIGEIFIGPDRGSYEVAAIVSATQLTLAEPYQGPGGGGQSYKIAPTSSFARDLALAFSGFKNTFGGILDTAGQGMFGPGSPAAPGLRNINDQDTGLRWVGPNSLSLVTGGLDRLLIDETGIVSFPSGFRPSAAATLGVSVGGGTVSYEHPVTRHYLGDGTGYSVRFAKRAASVTTDLMTITDGGDVGIGTTAISSRLEVQEAGTGAGTGGITASTGTAGGNAGFRWATGGSTRFSLTLTGAAGAETLRLRNENNGTQPLAVDASGNLLVGVTTGSSHVIKRNVGAGAPVMQVRDNTYAAVTMYAVSNTILGESGTACALGVAGTSATGRSINAGGTGNFSGSDYAEYIRKALNCGTILKGDVCGIDRNAELVRTWSDAVRYVVKSTDPSLVGGDTWAGHLPPRPEAPGAAPVSPTAPIAPAPLPASPIAPVREDGETDEAFMPRAADFFAACLTYETLAGEHTAYQEALAAYPELLAVHRTAHAAWQADVDAYDVDLQAWEGQLETARQCVDRIAFSGQVPVNVDDATLAACEAALADGVAVYLVAVARGAGIGVVAVREADMALAQYMKRVGAVWAIREGRPWIDVQHG